MKLYTLTYDCNRPMPQQINVPTNTDYKVGIKVKRNGAYQNLKAAEVNIGALSADDGDVNGYITFTGKTGDEATSTQDAVDIKHGYDDSIFRSSTMQNTGSSQMTLNGNVLSATAEDLGLAGKTINADNFYGAVLRNTDAAPTEADILSAMENPFYSEGGAWQNRYIVTKSNGGYIITMTGVTRTMYLDYAKEQGWWKESDGAIFFYVPAPSAQWIPAKTYTFNADDIITIGWGKLAVGKYATGAIQLNFGTPFDAKFQLMTNTFKSQQGDLAAGIATNKTVAFAGEYADGTEFSYDILVK